MGRHYYTQLMQCEALAAGACWLEREGESGRAGACREAAQAIEAALGDFWSEAEGFYKSRIGPAGEKDLDIATLLAVLHAGRRRGAHSVEDPKVAATVTRLEELFAGLYKINQPPRKDRAPALGRYRNDRYYSGGAYYFSTLGAAEFYFRAAARPRPPPVTMLKSLLRRGDLFMATVAAFTPSNGDLAEQFDQTTGSQASAKNLAWSHAAFVSAFAARADAMRAMGAKGGAA